MPATRWSSRGPSSSRPRPNAARERPARTRSGGGATPGSHNARNHGVLMFDALIRSSLRHRGFVLLALVGLAASGAYSLSRLPIDALPDITNVQVAALTDAPAL